MKKIVVMLLCAMMTATLSSCGSQSNQTTSAKNETNETISQVEFQGGENSSNRTLIVYFSYFDNTDGENITSKQYADAMASASVTIVDGKRKGNNNVVVENIKSQISADVFSILTKEQYPSNYDGGFVQQAYEDEKKQTRPELASHISNLDQYDTVILLYPVWWYDMPMAVYTFLDEYDLSGKTIAPIATSGGSGLLNTVDLIKKAEPNATVTEGLAIAQEKVVDSTSEINTWLAKTGIKK